LEDQAREVLKEWREKAGVLTDSTPYDFASADCALILWDGISKTLLLRRDRLGTGSIYYCQVDKTFYFSNRLEPLVVISGVTPSISAKALDYYLTYLHPPSDYTFFRDIRKLAPGRAFLWSPEGGGEASSGWKLTEEAYSGGFTRAACSVRDLLESAVRHTAEQAERPGLLFSGGTDSTALLQILRRGQEKSLLTFTAAAEGNPDLEYSEKLAEAFGVENVRIVLRPDVIAETWDEVIGAMDEPLGNSSALATHQVAKAASGRVDALISGIGSDEIFAGHLKHVLAHWAPLLWKWPAAGIMMKPFVDRSGHADSLGRFIDHVKAGQPPLEAYRTLYHHLDETSRKNLMSRKYRESLVDEEVAQNNSDGKDTFSEIWKKAAFMQRVMTVDVETWLLDDLIPTFSTMTRPAGLSGIFPFCDPALMDVSARIPFGWKVRGWEGKRILKRALKPVLPASVLKRGRQGFTQPLGRWFQGPWKEVARKRLMEKGEASGLVDLDAVQEIWEKHQSGRQNFAYVLWALIVLLGWGTRYTEAG
jgi:asparagine synthase (glutamine-hydrolysing)